MPRIGSKRKKTRTHIPVDPEKESKIPKSIIVKRGSIGKSLSELVLNFRKLMLPYTAIHLAETKKNTIKDFINAAAPLGVSHLLVFSQQTLYPKLRLGCYPHGPTLHFRILEYALMKDITHLQVHPPEIVKTFQISPAVILNNFPQDSKPLQLVAMTFKNMFPALDPSTMNIEDCKRILLLHYDKSSGNILLRHYVIKQTVLGISKHLKDLIQKQIPNLGSYHDISECRFLLQGQDTLSMDGETEDSSIMGEIESNERNSSPLRTAVKLIEVGPRLCMTLIKVEKDLYDGECIYTQEDQEEKKDVIKQSEEAKKTKELEKQLLKQEEKKVIDFTTDQKKKNYNKKNKKEEKFIKPLPKKNIKQRITLKPSRPTSKHIRK